MELNEIKKALYKEKPLAKRLFMDDNVARYEAKTKDGECYFVIPLNDAHGANLQDTMPSQLLIRWLNSFFPFEK